MWTCEHAGSMQRPDLLDPCNCRGRFKQQEPAHLQGNWSLWGRVYCASRSSLGMQRAKSMIAICAAEKATAAPSEAFEVTLRVVEGDL
jgi:hypothetical protein